MIWGKQKLLRVSGRFELSRVQVTDGKIRVICMTQIQRKSILVRVIRGRFDLSGVNCIHQSPNSTSCLSAEVSQPLAEFPFVNNRCLVWKSEKISDLLLKVLDWPTNFPKHLRIHFNKLPSYLIYHNGTQDLGLNFVLCKTIKNVFFSYYYNCNLIQGICEIYQQLPY